jgi:cell division topological specificity factor
MNFSTLLDRLFQRQNITSGTQVKQRLKFILAHDRAAIEPQVFDNMRHEIMRVVSKYVELDEGALDIRLESDKRMTALIANLPIKMVREELPDLVALFDEPSEVTDLNSKQADPLALEMDQFAEDALDAIAAKENPKSAIENHSDDSTGLAERNIELTSKLRNAANKSQNDNQNNSNGDRAIAQDKSDKDSSVASVVNDLVDTNNPISNNDDLASDVHENIEESDDQSSDQLELSLGLPSDLASKEVVVDESPELYNQSQELTNQP